MTPALAPASAPFAGAPQPTSDAGCLSCHGRWAPGVRLFRALRFRAEAAIIPLALIAPLRGLTV